MGPEVRYVYASPIGCLLMEDGREGLRALRLADRGQAPSQGEPPEQMTEAVCQLDAYFSGERREFDLPLSLSGTPFERLVWDRLRAIPHGETRTYGEIAASIGRPGASRAVGRACGANPVLVVVPCHRVVGAGGKLTGFAAGLDAKRALLELEGHSIAGDSIRK